MQEVWQSVPVEECGEALVNLVDFGVLCEPAYFNMGLSDNPVIQVRESVAVKLARVDTALAGLRLKVWDGFRPRSVQRAIYRQFWDELQKQHPDWSDDELHTAAQQFVAPPDLPGTIPPHTTGGAVDLTLADLDGLNIDMGTGFDDFSPKAATFSDDISDDARRNRDILLAAMSNEGFVNYSEEWWHFGYGDPLSAVICQLPKAIYGELTV